MTPEPVAIAHDHLVQVDGIREARERCARSSIDAPDLQAGRHLQLGDRDAGAAQRVDALGGILELDSGVAQVDADAQVSTQRALGFACTQAAQASPATQRCRCPQLALEERDGLGSRLEHAAGLRLERKHDRATAVCTQAHEVRGVLQQVLDDARPRGRCRRVRLERARHGAHAAFERRIVRQQLLQQVSEPVAVGQPFRIGPVRQVHRLLDARAVEAPVGEAVDRVDVELLGRQEGAELRERCRLLQLAGREGRKTQADAERGVGTDALA